jgi:hypothetical protein
MWVWPTHNLENIVLFFIVFFFYGWTCKQITKTILKLLKLLARGIKREIAGIRKKNIDFQLQILHSQNMKAAFHKYVSVWCNLGTGTRMYFLHVIERADGVNLFFATDFYGWPVENQPNTYLIAEQYKQGDFENAEENLVHCPAYL